MQQHSCIIIECNSVTNKQQETLEYCNFNYACIRNLDARCQEAATGQ